MNTTIGILIPFIGTVLGSSLVFFSKTKIPKQFENIITSLQYSGIGGKRSSGYGKFEYDSFELGNNSNLSEKTLLELLNKIGKYNMSLSLISPNETDLEKNFSNSYYNLIKRNGYIYSVDYDDKLLKRKNLVMFKEGSCFDVELEGTIHEVSDEDKKHPVYRYGKALKIGVAV